MTIILSQQFAVVTSVLGGETACLQFPMKVLPNVQGPSLTIALFIVSLQHFSLSVDFLYRDCYLSTLGKTLSRCMTSEQSLFRYLMFIGPCIIVIVEE